MTSVSPELQGASVDIDALFRLYHAELRQFAYRRTRNRETAADVVQDAFLRYMDCGLTVLAERTHPRFFLWRVVGNLTIDIARRDKRRGPPTPIDDLSEQLVDPNPTPYEQLAMRQQFMLLRKALGDLPASQRTALLLNRIDGMSHIQIAETLGVSTSMVSKYVMAALRHCLRQMHNAGY